MTATLRRFRMLALAMAGVMVVALCALTVIADRNHANRAAQATTPAPLAIGTELPTPKRLPEVQLVDAQGRPYSLTATHGRWIVLAPSMTLCHEVCPMTTGVLQELQAGLRRDKLGHQVSVVEATVDPWRDSPARLRAYKRMFGANFTMLTGSQAAIRRLWRFFGVQYYRVSQGDPPDIDWWTHTPETFDVQHTDAFFIIDPAGQERIVNVGMPELDGSLSKPLRSLLSSEGVRNLEHPSLPWTAGEVIDDMLNLTGRNVPAQTAARPASAAAAVRELAGSPTTLAALHARAGKLYGPGLQAQITALRGHPIVLNAWASWCDACRGEFPLMAIASARYGRRVAFLGADVGDSAANARTFLGAHQVSYPSYTVASTSSLAPWAQVVGLPATIFINAAGKVVGRHLLEYQSLASLDNDIEQYSLGVGG